MTGLSELDARIESAAAELREHDSLTHRIARLDTTLAGHRERIGKAKETVSAALVAVNAVVQRLHSRHAIVAALLGDLGSRREALLTAP